MEWDSLYRKGVAKFKIGHLSRRFGISYNQFLFQIGEQPYRLGFLNMDEVLDMYEQVKKEKGRVPRYDEVPFTLNTLKNLGFDSYRSFLEKVDDTVNRREFSIETFIADVLSVWGLLGRQPTINEYKIFGKCSIHSLFRKREGSWTGLIKKLGGINLMFARGGWNKISKNKLEDEYVRVRNIIGHPVTEDDFEMSKYSKCGYLRVWGKLSNAQRYLEEKYFDNYFHPTKEDCIDVYIEKRKKLGEPVPISRIKKISHSIYEKKFGNLTNAKNVCEKEFIKRMNMS